MKMGSPKTCNAVVRMCVLSLHVQSTQFAASQTMLHLSLRAIVFVLCQDTNVCQCSMLFCRVTVCHMTATMVLPARGALLTQ